MKSRVLFGTRTVDANENEEEDEAFDIAENFTTGQTVSSIVCL